jgi:hypothetical protein
MSEKGDEIRFVGGIYSGKTGWFNAAKNHTPCMFYVIVALDGGEEKATKVNKKSARLLSTTEEEPSSFAEACLRQNPDIDASIDKLAQLLAQCGITVASEAEMGRILSERVAQACIAQNMKGNKATWRHVNWGFGEGGSEDFFDL